MVPIKKSPGTVYRGFPGKVSKLGTTRDFLEWCWVVPSRPIYFPDFPKQRDHKEVVLSRSRQFRKWLPVSPFLSRLKWARELRPLESTPVWPLSQCKLPWKKDLTQNDEKYKKCCVFWPMKVTAGSWLFKIIFLTFKHLFLSQAEKRKSPIKRGQINKKGGLPAS